MTSQFVKFSEPVDNLEHFFDANFVHIFLELMRSSEFPYNFYAIYIVQKSSLSATKYGLDLFLVIAE